MNNNKEKLEKYTKQNNKKQFIRIMILNYQCFALFLFHAHIQREENYI